MKTKQYYYSSKQRLQLQVYYPQLFRSNRQIPVNLFQASTDLSAIAFAYPPHLYITDFNSNIWIGFLHF